MVWNVALVCLLHGAQVGGALFFEDHDGRVAESDQRQVQGQSWRRKLPGASASEASGWGETCHTRVRARWWMWRIS